MSWLTKLFGGKREVEKGLTQDDVIRIMGGGRDDVTKDAFPTFGDAALMALMSKNALVNACITALSRGFQEAEITVTAYNAEEDSWVEQETSELLNPFMLNPDLSESDLKQYMMLHIQTTGKSFLWKWKSPDGVTRELWPIPPSWVKFNLVDQVVNDPTKPRVIAYYTVTPDDASGRSWDILPEDMIYTRFPDPRNLYDGLSPTRAASKNIYLDVRGDDYKAESITALSVPSIVIKTRKQLNSRQKDDLRSALRRKTGTDPRANAFMLSGDDVSLDFLNPMAEMNWPDYTDLNETRICMAYGVPPIVIGAWVGLKNSPWSNTEEAKKWMYKNTLAALWKLFGCNLTRGLLDPESRKLFRIEFDTSDIKEMQDDEKEISDRATKLFAGGLITRNEARQILNYDTDDDGDVYQYGANTMLVPVGGSEMMGVQPEPNPMSDQTMDPDEEEAPEDGMPT